MDERCLAVSQHYQKLDPSCSDGTYWDATCSCWARRDVTWACWGVHLHRPHFPSKAELHRPHHQLGRRLHRLRGRRLVVLARPSRPESRSLSRPKVSTPFAFSKLASSLLLRCYCYSEQLDIQKSGVCLGSTNPSDHETIFEVRGWNGVVIQMPGLVASSTTSSRDSLPRPLPGSGTGYRSLDKNTYLVAVGGCLTTVIS